MSMTVNDSTIKAEGLGNFFMNVGKKKTYCIKKDGKNRFKETFTSIGYYSRHSYRSCKQKLKSGSLKITRVDNILQHWKGSLPW